MRPLMTIALLGFLASSTTLPAQSTQFHEPDWQQVCQKATAADVEQPAMQLPAAQSQSCDETNLYYGISGKADYPAALACGWQERAHPKPTEANMFYGPGVLTMLYANGRAVQRNYELAIRFACEQDWASPAEMELRLGHLEAMRDGKVEPAAFDLCDDITSGLSMGACTSIQTGRADAKRDAEIAAVAARLPAESHQLFEKLRKAERAFEESRSGDEVDLSGTARVMFELQEQRRLGDQFLINLQRFGSGDVPHATASDVAALDRALNGVYQDIQTAPASNWQWGTIRPEGIRETERAWVALADAWAEFAHEAYPNLEATTVRAQIVRLRLHQLRSLAPRQN